VFLVQMIPFLESSRARHGVSCPPPPFSVVHVYTRVYNNEVVLIPSLPCLNFRVNSGVSASRFKALRHHLKGPSHLNPLLYGLRMSLDVWKFVLHITRLRRRTPIIRCTSGQPTTHLTLGECLKRFRHGSEADIPSQLTSKRIGWVVYGQAEHLPARGE
jgi:hypothetical protein